jgi:hypothetical protein
VVPLEGEPVASESLIREGTWVVIQVEPDCASCDALLARMDDDEHAALAPRIAVIVTTDVARARAMARRFPRLHEARWVADPISASRAALGLPATPHGFGPSRRDHRVALRRTLAAAGGDGIDPFVVAEEAVTMRVSVPHALPVLFALSSIALSGTPLRAGTPPLPAFEVKAPDGSVASSAELGGPDRWLLVYLVPSSTGADRLLPVLREEWNDTLAAGLVFVVAGTTDEARAYLKSKGDGRHRGGRAMVRGCGRVRGPRAGAARRAGPLRHRTSRGGLEARRSPGGCGGPRCGDPRLARAAMRP